MRAVTELLKLHEGLRLDMYTCTAGKLTIGYGLNLEAGITEEEASLLLEMRLKDIELDLACEFDHWFTLSEVRQAVLMDMGYNLGIAGLKGFKNMIEAVNDGDFNRAADEMLDSKYAKDVGYRAARLSYMMRSNQWPSDIDYEPEKTTWLSKLLELFKV